MTRITPASDRRSDALSRDRIVDAAIEILDTQGERALTFRALATRLSTGAGAIYWHIADKEALLAAASDRIVGLALARVGTMPDPRDAIRAHALALFDAFEAHAWVGTSLSLDPLQTEMVRFLERIGGSLVALGVPLAQRFDAWSACVNYILGVAGQSAAHARHQPPDANRDATLRAVAESWNQLDPSTYPFLHEAAAYLPGHDDRLQFLAGINLILAGLNQTPS
ncbi:TetR/AcrR family transcriptional regulator [Kozakia baliensis]|uniref:TetR family transcriptional regulator n=1 Tax=Kozakia baliensis TaxID=153496 RepID=A0A1D8USG2_9PROT|nr:TetR/AcrR family transcriptional regulator [Kozakia baliensis]AOX16579.1 TetR family transcriptional regulator [Kozakia baliensis]GBR34323.1 TetR family transcriptional regulator [Kozakia baliensis NRIC 0488]GEL65541.1 TetR family transcriptional regulator [Kozakia baliensis]